MRRRPRAAAWVADQSGDVALTWGGWRIQTSLPVFALALGLVIVAAMLLWSILRGLWRAPERVRRGAARAASRARPARHHPRTARGRPRRCRAARAHADVAQRHAADDPLALLLHAQSAQLDGDRDGAQRAFRAMAERKDTRLLGLRGLFIEAQRADDPVAAVAIAEEALKTRAVVDLGVARGAGIPLRQGRLDRRAGDPRQQSRMRA